MHVCMCVQPFEAMWAQPSSTTLKKRSTDQL